LSLDPEIVERGDGARTETLEACFQRDWIKGAKRDRDEATCEGT